MLLNHLCQWSLSIHPENIRKSEVLCFQGVYKDISGMRWVNIFLNFFEITLIFLNKQQV